MPLITPLRARMYLLRATIPPALATHEFVVAHGPVDAVERIRAGAVPDAVRREITRPDLHTDTRDLDAIDTGTARLVTPEDDEWPHGQLRHLQTTQLGTPLALWVRGTPQLADTVSPSMCVTGSNAPNDGGGLAAAEFASHAAAHGVTVLSGGSYGVEGIAHRAAVPFGRTVAVLAGGVDVVHPLGHRALFTDIVDSGGLLVSEYPIGAAPTLYRKATRYRLLAALSQTTVITEARLGSKVMETAFAAGLLRRPVYVVTRGMPSVHSAGGHELVRAGLATGVTAARDIALPRDRR